MQQRQLRLGDILDDYCPRERRLTNHVVVAMIGLDVKQTRCSTCETEHEYKQAKLPRLRRKADAFAALAAQAPGGVGRKLVTQSSAQSRAVATRIRGCISSRRHATRHHRNGGRLLGGPLTMTIRPETTKTVLFTGR